MLTTETLQHIAQGEAIDAAARAFDNAPDAMYVLPNNFQVHDLERHMTTRRRARGVMKTSTADDGFGKYVETYAMSGAAIFVSAQHMQATCVLNLGTQDAPGHADDLAIYAPHQTAAYKALLAITGGAGKSQREISEFLEDWVADLQCFHGDLELAHAQAVRAVRSVTIESLSKAQTMQEQLSASRSAFDQVKAVSDEGKLPTRIVFSCEPYLGFQRRAFALRLSMLTSDKAPAISLRIVRHEEHIEGMAAELVDIVSGCVRELDLPVMVGEYMAGK
jgi:uncharacterized protein YfdQ (DUF2303 family)